MSDKIKYLTIASKLPKKKNKESWAKTVEDFAPDMYELLYGVAGKDAYKKVSELQPEIVWLSSDVVKNDLKKGQQMVQEIKHPCHKGIICVRRGLIGRREPEDCGCPRAV